MNEPVNDQDAGRTFRLLELIHQNGMLTQRELSRRLDIALGLVNLSLKRLMRQELVKVRRLSARRVVYLLTPVGMAEKGRLSARYLTDSFAMYRNARGVFLHHLAALRGQGVKRVLLVGEGPLAEAAFLTLHELGLQLVAVVGDGQLFLGHPVRPLDEIDPAAVDRVLFAVEGDDARWRAALDARGHVPERIDDLARLLLDAGRPQVPVQ
ncbi:MAG: winged helix-turn-helix transcriptional regulator [Nitrospirae bacterium]|nr:winged helix-turn-helix transcriptional regulator [Nitrospirota bacterium]